MFSHEASIIAAKERAEINMIELFIARKIVVDRAGHSITKRRARVNQIMGGSLVIPQSKNPMHLWLIR